MAQSSVSVHCGVMHKISGTTDVIPGMMHVSALFLHFLLTANWPSADTAVFINFLGFMQVTAPFQHVLGCTDCTRRAPQCLNVYIMCNSLSATSQILM